ncbi:MAG: winged helix-turn-helix domain-containing protein [Lysobacteraceae bacterium]
MDEPSADAAVRYRFGEFLLDPGRRALYRDGERVELQPKVFDLIVYLVEQRERAVSKDELQDTVWPRQVITETALTRAVMKARKALDDDASQPRMIATLQTHGYHFIAPVQVESRTPSYDSTVIVEAGERPPPEAEATTRPRDWPWLPIALVLLLGAVVVLWLWRREATEAPLLAGGEIARLAILPVDNASGDNRFDWARLGLVAGVSDYLETTRAAETVPLRNVTRLIDNQSPPLDSDADLGALVRRFAVTDGATHVVAASIEADAGALRLRYRLVDAAGNVRHRTLVGDSPTRLMSGLAADLAAQFDAGGERRNVPDDEFANEAYLRGKAAMLSGDYDGAVTLFESALSQAPGALWPRLELALIARNRRQFDDAEAQFGALIDDARRRGDTAVEFSAVNSLGNLYLMSERIEQAEPRWQEALALAERQDEPYWMAKVLHNLSIAANVRQDRQQARDYIQKASEAFTRAGFEVLPPQLAMKIGDQHHIEGQLDTAEHYVEQAIHGYRTLGILNAEALSIANLAHIRRDQGRLDESAALLAQTIEMLRRAQDQQRTLGTTFGELGAVNSERGDSGGAEAAFVEAQPLLEPLRERIPLAALELRRAKHRLGQGDLAAAATDLEAALGHYREGRLPYGESLTLATLSRLSAATGNADQAVEFAEQARQAAETGNTDEGRVDAAEATVRARFASEGASEAVIADWSAFHQGCPDRLPGKPFSCVSWQLDAARSLLAAGRSDVATDWIGAVRVRMPHAPGLDAAETALQTAQTGANPP